VVAATFVEVAALGDNVVVVRVASLGVAAHEAESAGKRHGVDDARVCP
jgi:hypothetical protein